MGLTIKLFLYDLLFVSDLQKRVSKETWNFLSEGLKLLLSVACLYLAGYSVYYSIEIITSFWNEYFIEIFNLPKAEVADILKFFITFYICKWVFVKAPDFSFTSGKMSFEDHYNKIVSRGFVFLLCQFTNHLFTL